MVEEDSKKANSEAEQLREDDPVWSLAGFEVFDLIVIATQALIYLTAASVGPVLEHPICRFLMGIGFVATVAVLGRTRVYARGVQQIESEHSHLWAVIYVGGTALGIIVLTVYIFGPIKKGLDELGLDSSWLSIPGVPLSIVALAFLPYMAIRVEKKDLGDSTQFVKYPVTVHYIGRAIILLLANSIMHTLYHGFAEENEVLKSINGIAVMLLFYVPVRIQEMFLRPDGPHFQSLFQTMAVLALGGLGALMT